MRASQLTALWPPVSNTDSALTHAPAFSELLLSFSSCRGFLSSRNHSSHKKLNKHEYLGRSRGHWTTLHVLDRLACHLFPLVVHLFPSRPLLAPNHPPHHRSPHL